MIQSSSIPLWAQAHARRGVQSHADRRIQSGVFDTRKDEFIDPRGEIRSRLQQKYSVR